MGRCPNYRVGRGRGKRGGDPPAPLTGGGGQVQRGASRRAVQQGVVSRPSPSPAGRLCVTPRKPIRCACRVCCCRVVTLPPRIYIMWQGEEGAGKRGPRKPLRGGIPAPPPLPPHTSHSHTSSSHDTPSALRGDDATFLTRGHRHVNRHFAPVAVLSSGARSKLILPLVLLRCNQFSIK